MLIYVSGKIQYQEYENKEGSKVRATNILVSDMKMLESKKTQSGMPENKQQLPESSISASEPDDVPF